MSGLSAGGPSAVLPKGWTTPWGYKGEEIVRGALWIRRRVCETAKIQELEAGGHTADPMTLVGTTDIRWNARQYLDVDRSALGKFELLPAPGGDGSAKYRYQKLPKGMMIVKPGVWVVFPTGKAYRSYGGEVAYTPDFPEVELPRLVPDLNAEWDEAKRLWVLL